MISPITGQQVPVEQMAEHMRIALLDPKWKEKSGLVKAGEKEDTLAQGDDVGRSLAKMAAKRKDIFGTDEEVFGDNKADAAAPPPSKVAVATFSKLSLAYIVHSCSTRHSCIFARDYRRLFFCWVMMGQQLSFFFSPVIFCFLVMCIRWCGMGQQKPDKLRERLPSNLLSAYR
jgi:hypothetical protein